MRFLFSLGLAVLAILPFHPANAQSLDEMAGQMVFVGFDGASLDSAGVAAIRDQIAAGQIGGVMYLKTNVQSLAAVREINRALVSARPWLPPFIGLDQEGGQVERLTASVGFQEVPAAAVLARRGIDAAQASYIGMAQDLAAQGFNVNFGPVVDLNRNPDNPVIARYQRAYSSDPGVVTALAEAFVAAHRAAGLATALKHFPGHGSSTEDSHEGFVDVTGLWDPVELEPYRAMIDRGEADMVMVAHLFNADDLEDADLQLPASLSS